MIETAKVAGRRRLRFASYEEILDDARRLASGSTRSLGNWTLGQVCRHLAIAMEQSSVGDLRFPVPLRARIFGRLFRSAILNSRIPSGFRLPNEASSLIPEPISPELGLATLQRAIEGLKATSRRVSHPVLGAMTVEQWDLFHLRHAEMHLSFILPE